MKSFKRFFCFFLCMWFIGGFVFAADVPLRPQGYVTDLAGVLDGQSERLLESQLASIDRATSNQVMILIVSSLEGDNLEDYSIRVAEQWKTGIKKLDNGVIVLVAQAEKKVRIEVGYGLEPILTDAICSMVIQRNIIPSFRQGRIDVGLLYAIEELGQHLGYESDSSSSRVFSQGRADRSLMVDQRSVNVVFFMILLVAVTISIVDLFKFRHYRVQTSIMTNGYSFFEWWLRFSILLFCLKLLCELAFYMMLASGRGRGGYYGGGSGGGFSGGGGGSFGGGGASGGW